MLKMKWGPDVEQLLRDISKNITLYGGCDLLFKPTGMVLETFDKEWYDGCVRQEKTRKYQLRYQRIGKKNVRSRTGKPLASKAL